jgi:hypothetical protein
MNVQWFQKEVSGKYCTLKDYATIKRMKWVGHVTGMGEERNVYRVLMGKPEGKRPLGRPRRNREDGIRMDLREIGWGSVDWIQLAGSCQYGDEPSGSGTTE